MKLGVSQSLVQSDTWSSYIRLGLVTYTSVAVSRRPSSRRACGPGAGDFGGQARVERCCAGSVKKRQGGGAAGRGGRRSGAALRFGRRFDHAATSSSSSSSMTCPRSSSSTEWWTFLLCGRDVPTVLAVQQTVAILRCCSWSWS